MSADNGIYILETSGSEFRVSMLQAVENYMWDDNLQQPDKSYCGGYSNNPDIQIVNAREMWKDCKVYSNSEDAMTEAKIIYDEIMSSDFPILEYGISFIKIDRKF